MNYAEIDRLAESALMASGDENWSKGDPVTGDSPNLISTRVMEIPFDCTPNWGIHGLTRANNDIKGNWYRRDPEIDERYRKRVRNVNTQKLGHVVLEAIGDIVGGGASVLGYSFYGSYLYREAYSPPEDLDVIVIVKSDMQIAYDALRYRSKGLKSVFFDRSYPIPSTDDMGLTIISENVVTPSNRSYIVTDSALLDTSTTYSVGRQITADQIPPFVLMHNAQKILRWGISTLQDKPTSTLSRIDEAFRMRDMVVHDNPHLGLQSFDMDKHLPPASDVFRGLSDDEVSEIARVVIRQFQSDEMRIREYVANRIADK